MEEEKLVAIISPWEKLSEVVRAKFRVESLPRPKKVMVWRSDLQQNDKLEAELRGIGIREFELCRKKVVTQWDDR